MRHQQARWADLANRPDFIEGVHYLRLGDQVFPIVRGGADGDDDGGGGSDGTGGDDDSGSDGGGSDAVSDGNGSGAGSDSGKDEFPANTPVAEMTAAQQAAYWKHQSKKHERTSKDNFNELEKVRKANQTAEEKALDQARSEGEKAGIAKAAPKLVRAEMVVAANGRLTGKAIDSLLESLDHTKLLSDDGDVDTDKVAALIEGIAGPKSDKDDTKRQRRDLGQGKRETGAKPSAQERADARLRKHGLKADTAGS